MAEEPQEEVQEEQGDPAPAPSRRKRAGAGSRSSSGNGRRRATQPKRETAADGAEQAAEALVGVKPRRTTSAARRGGEVVWGLGGTGVQVGGQVAGAPGLVAAGWVMQAQAKDGGRYLAQRLLDTRWYPYLEKLGRGGAGNMVFAAPICVALYVQVPPVRGLLEPVIQGMLGKLTVEAPDGQGGLQHVPLWQAIKLETAAQDARDAEARAEAEAMAQATAGSANGAGTPDGWVPPVTDEPEPGVEHVRSRYNDLADQVSNPPPEI